MDPLEISKLAKHLRSCGDKVLNGNFKLSLSGSLLRALNDSFSLIADENEIYAPQTFQVVKPNNSKSDAFRDLQFIHDFVQKTEILKLTTFPNDDFDSLIIDITKFRSLKILEIQRINIKKIIGIQRLRPYIAEITCFRSIKSVEDIISHCGGDNSSGFNWETLNSADFSYNNLTKIDSSLEFVQYLQHLNLSHNKLVTVKAIKWLPNLKVINLGFNRLTHIPTFHIEATRRLQTLILSNNFIEDISGVSCLDALTELDLSGNCIVNNSSLLPLSTLATLSFLNLLENPLSYHPCHRQITAEHLHKNTSSVKFMLNSQPLTKVEKALTGNTYLPTKTLIRSFGARSSGQSTPTRLTNQSTPVSSVGSTQSNRLVEPTESNSNDEIIVPKLSQKKFKIRKAVIADIVDDVTKEKSTSSNIGPERNREHLETKKQIESLRKQFGDGWLHSEGASMVHSVLGIENERIEKPISSEQMIQSLLDETIGIGIGIGGSTSTPIGSHQATKVDLDSVAISKVNDEATVSDENNGCTSLNDVATEQLAVNTSMLEKSDPLAEIYGESTVDYVISDAEDNENAYIVYLEPTDNEMILVVSDISMKEKDIYNGRTKTRWTLRSLESCDRLKADVLRLNFDTIKKDKKERIYRVEKGLCQKLEQYLRGILAKRPLSEMNQTIYRCANCTSQFSRENFLKHQNIEIMCPECKSSYVIEIKESPRAQSIERVAQYLQNLKSSKSVDNSENRQLMETSKSQSSIAPKSSTAWIRPSSNTKLSSATSLNESSSCSKISNSISSFDSNQSVAGSSNCDRDADFMFNKNGDSDIEILSNPSQSSIGIIDSIQSSRKHSEERRFSQTEGLDITASEYIANLQLLNGAAQTILVNQQTSTQDLSNHKNECTAEREKKTALSGLLLTESSSSGSVTDSICTTYEQNHADNTITETSPNKTSSPVNDNVSRNDSVISSMFGGLFQSTSLLMSKSQKSDRVAKACDKFKFSYTDFDNVDHRLKLFLYQNIFEDDKEHLKWLVKGKLFNDNGNQASNAIISNAIMVASTTKFYVLQIVGEECEDISKWIKRQISGTIDRIETIRVLPWKVGVTLTIKGIGTMHLILQDIERTDSLLLFFANNPLPIFCTLEYQISERLSQKLLKVTDNAQLKMFSILENCETSIDDVTITRGLVGLLITESNLYLTCPAHQWLSDKIDVDIVAIQEQLMSNLVEVEKLDNKTLRINFLDENQDKCELWTCSFIVDSCLDSTLNAISISWEKLFGVPLANN